MWDVSGKRYLDMGGGIAVNSLGHAHPSLTSAIHEQIQKLMHISNLYYCQPQSDLAAKIVGLMGGHGKVFFCNSGAEANEGMYKLARKFGSKSDTEAGRYEILTAVNSFHGRTLGGIAATGQAKIKAGFFPMCDGFRHIPFNDLPAAKAAIGDKTVAVMIEGIQGEGGILAATPEYLMGLRELCDQRNLLLLFDGVQCGHFRTGTFQSFTRLLEGVPGGEHFKPDAFSMAKSLGGGFPIGGIWINDAHADILTAGYHGTTYGGNPAACAAALKVLEVIQQENLADNARQMGSFLKSSLQDIVSLFPEVIKSVRGTGLMIGLEISKSAFPAELGGKPSGHFVQKLHDNGVLAVPSGDYIVRLLPALNLSKEDASTCIEIIEAICADLTETSADENLAAQKALEHL